jgi:hypothetical protein
VHPTIRFIRARTTAAAAVCAAFGALLILPANLRAQEIGAQARVALTATVEKQEYCLQPDGRTNLRLALQLEFHNVSQGKIVISQKSNTVDGMDIVDYTSGATANPWPHITIDRIPAKTDRAIPPSPGAEFAILKPGKTLHTNAVVHVDLLHSKLPGDGPVNPGKYSMAVVMATWLDTDVSAAAARTQWHKAGYLISDDVKSAPMEFSVSANPQFRDCGYHE